MSGMNPKPPIYHEKQVKELCALHALNNLFQKRGTYSKAELDGICSRLSPNVWINPHRSLLGLGNYDINVIMAALQKKGCEALWFDKRKDPGCLNLSYITGFILNVPSDYRLGFVMLPLRRRHWITIRQIAGSFYNLDSKLDAPLLIGRSSELIAYLKEQLECKDKELFVIVDKEVDEKHLWMRPVANSLPQSERSQFGPCTDVAQNSHGSEFNQNSHGSEFNQNSHGSEFNQNSHGSEFNQNSSSSEYTQENNTQVNHSQRQDSSNSPTSDSLSSYSTYDHNNRDAECVNLSEVRNCV